MHWEGSVEVPCKSKAPVALLSTCFLWFWMLEIQHSSGTLWLQLWSEGAIDGGSLQGPLQYPMPSQTLPGLPGSSSYLHDLHGTYHNHPESLVIHWLFTGLQHMRVFNWSTQEMRKSLSRSDRGMGQVSVVQWSWKHIATDSNNYIFAELFIIVHNCSSFLFQPLPLSRAVCRMPFSLIRNSAAWVQSREHTSHPGKEISDVFL
jgi:hypothetical protein